MEQSSDELDHDRRRARRRMALASFILVSLKSAAVTYALVYSDARAEIATALVTASPVIIGILTLHASIILGYLGVSVAEKIFHK